jgi:uncharacterized protein (DUF1499 family)
MFSLPIINDITTTYPNPPEFQEIRKIESKRDYGYPAGFLEKQKAAYSLAPLPMTLGREEAFKKVEAIAKTMGWQVVAVDPAQFRLEAIDTTKLLRFKDDIVIEVRATAEGAVGPVLASDVAKAWVHMRSKSRTGKGDLGKNAERIKSFFEVLSRTSER